MVSKIWRKSLQEDSEQRNNPKKDSESKKAANNEEDSKEDSEPKKRRPSIEDAKEESKPKNKETKKRRASRIEEWIRDPTQDPKRKEHKRRAEKRVENIRKRAKDAQEALRDAESLLNLGEDDQKEITRAKVVIKKAMLKKMERSQVEKFLESKGVRKKIINQAYKEIKAENTPEASIEYYKKLSERSAREASDATIENKQLKRKIKEMEEEIANLRGTVTISVQILQRINQLMFPEE